MSDVDPPIVFRPPSFSDLDAINVLYRREYGDRYPYQLREEDLAAGIAFAAFAGESVVGCARAVRPNPAAPVFLFGGMIVDPPHRRRHVAKALTDLRFDAVRRAGARVVVTEPVCCQPSTASQRNVRGYGFVALGLLPAKYPDIKPETLGDQPESLTLAVRWLHAPVSFEGRRMFAGARISELLAAVAPDVAATADGSAPVPSGPVPRPEYHEPMRGTRSDGSSFVDVPASWPESLAMVESHERDGYAVCGFLPGLGLTARGERYDLVRMVHPRGRRVRFEHVHVTEELLPMREHLAVFCGE